MLAARYHVGMELNASIIIISVLLIGLGIVVWYAYQLKNQLRAREAQIIDLTGSKNNDLFGKGKFSELGLMSAGIAHELSNPLTVIQGHLTQIQRLYRDSTREKEVARGLQQIKNSSERIAKIIDSLRKYIYRDDLQEEKFISLSEIISSLLMFCGERLKNHGIELRLINIEGVYLSGHRGQYEQALLNLVNNSFDAVDNLPEKWIEISAVENGNMVDIYVKDSGHGISNDVKSHMLTPFYTTKLHKGTGLGLPLVKSIAELHGGELVYIEKSPNTTFLLELPKGISFQ